MVRSLNSNKKTSNKSIEKEGWTTGENFNFKSSPSLSLTRNKTNRRSIGISPKKDVNMNNRRKTIYTKRLDAEISLLLPNSPISRRTRRQSMANISRIEPNKLKDQLQNMKSQKISPKVNVNESKIRLTRTKSENISKKTSLTVKKSNIDLNESTKKLSRTKSENITLRSKAKLPRKVGSSQLNVDESKERIKLETTSSSNKKLPSKGTKSISELNESKTKIQRTKSENINSKSVSSAVKNPSKVELNKSTSRASKAKSESTLSKNKNSRLKLSPRIKLLKLNESEVSSLGMEESRLGLSSKLSIMQISNDTFYKSPKRSPNNVSRRKSMSKMMEMSLSPKASNLQKSLHMKSSPPAMSPPKPKTLDKKPKSVPKPLKRLSVSTPPPRPVWNKRLTRSAAKKLVAKRVQIRAQSPPTSERFLKTPIASRAEEKDKHSASENACPKSPVAEKKRYINPFTPMPEDPSKLLRRSLKQKVASAKRKATIQSKNESLMKSPRKGLVTARTPIRSGVKTSDIRDSFTSPSTSSSYNLPVTPLSSRKSSVSFRQYRDSVRDSGGASYRGTLPPLSSTLDSPLSSTPVRGKLRASGPSFLEHGSDEHLINLSNVSSAPDSSTEFTASFTKSYVAEETSVCDAMDEGTSGTEEEPDLLPPPSPQQKKKGYCALM